MATPACTALNWSPEFSIDDCSSAYNHGGTPSVADKRHNVWMPQLEEGFQSYRLVVRSGESSAAENASIYNIDLLCRTYVQHKD